MQSPLPRYVLAVAGYLLICLLASTSPIFAQNTRIESFNKAKKLMAQVLVGHETEFYCGCTYTGSEVDVASCGYQPKKDPDRAKRIEWEHVVLPPAKK
jgi:deoxyribonuclease-1